MSLTAIGVGMAALAVIGGGLGIGFVLVLRQAVP